MGWGQVYDQVVARNPGLYSGAIQSEPRVPPCIMCASLLHDDSKKFKSSLPVDENLNQNISHKFVPSTRDSCAPLYQVWLNKDRPHGLTVAAGAGLDMKR